MSYSRYPMYLHDREEDMAEDKIDCAENSKPIIQRAMGGGATNIANHYTININISPDTPPEQLKQILDIIKGSDSTPEKKNLKRYFKR